MGCKVRFESYMGKMFAMRNNTIFEHTMKALLQHFSQYIKLSDALKEAITARVQQRTYKKGEILHHADNICRSSYFIHKGILRLYFYKDGKEISEYFTSENEWTNSPRSFMFRKVDHYYIDAIENTEVYILQVDDLLYLFNNFPEMERYARLSMGTLVYHLIERVTSMRFTTAKEKYQHFCETYHDIHHRIPLGMIASYLGIAQETLSRLRGE